MSEQKSFVSLEHEYEKKFREYMNQAEDCVDIENFFKKISVELLNSALTKLKINQENIIIDYEKEKIKFSKDLKLNHELLSLIENSDIMNILDRFSKEFFNKVKHKKGLGKKVAKNLSISSKKM